MENPANSLCPHCGASLRGGQVEGLCARCVGVFNFAPDTVLPEDAAGGFTGFSRGDLDDSFPQLEILELLGRGGMGIVYKARQKQLGRVVALKLLPPERVADPKFAERFRREAQALASLNHPNIVAIHDFGQTNGLFYLLMEFVDGVNLRQAMNAGRFTPDQALAIVPPVCEALQFAHDHGIVHCDIKPENLLLDKHGRVKIADFGIAKMLGQEGTSSDLSESQPAGTPQYMAPEQRQSGETDPRVDIYSLGVVLYEMLTGELPESRLQPPSRRIQIDFRIDQIVLRALERTPELRFATAAEFQTSVEAITREESIRHTPNSRPAFFSRFALWGAGWAALCLISLPFLDKAWIGGFGSTVLGCMAVTEFQRAPGRVRGLWLAVFDMLLFPLLTVNAVIIMGAAASEFVSPIRNQPYPAMAASWPFIVIGFYVLTLILVALLDFLVVRAVWRLLNTSRSAGDHSASPWNWRVVLGSLLAVVGVAVVLGASAVNEFIDEFVTTKTAHNQHREQIRASRPWSDLSTAGREGAVARDVDRRARNAAEVARLTREAESLRQGAAGAEFSVTQPAMRREASERDRLLILYVIGGGLIAGGLFACFRDVRRNKISGAEKAVNLPRTGTAILVTPRELASAWNQCFCYRTRGVLMLDENTLTHSYSGGTTTMPLEAIRDVSIGQLPRLMNPVGLSVLSITYEDDGEMRQVLVSPIKGRLKFSQRAVYEWFAAIRNAVVAATGRKPSITPSEQLGIPQSSRMLSVALLLLSALLLLVLYLKHAEESLQTAIPSPLAGAARGFAVSDQISRNHHSVLAVHDDSSILSYVLYFPGDLLGASSGSRRLDDHSWLDEGTVKLRSGRRFDYARRSDDPTALRINGVTFDLRRGSVIVLRVDGNCEQINVFPTLAVARDPEAVGRLVVAEQDRVEKTGLVAYSISQAEVPEGTHDLSVRLRREWEKDPRLGVETSLHIVAGGSSDPARRMPKNGGWTARRRELIRGGEELTLVFAMPDEMPAARLREAATSIVRHHEYRSGGHIVRLPLVLGEEEPIKLATIAHPDGWECHLYLRLVRLDESGNPVATPDDSHPADSEADPIMEPARPVCASCIETLHARGFVV